MPDDLNKPEALPLPSVAQAVKDLTSDISQQEGGSRPNSSPDSWYPIRDIRDEKGRYAVVYSFDTVTPPLIDKAIKNPRPFDAQYRKQMRQVMDNIERIANIRFYEAGVPNIDLPGVEKETPETARLTFFKINDFDKEEAGGVALGGEVPKGKRTVFIKDGEEASLLSLRALMLHELSHAVAALSHPDEANKHNLYPAGLTVMGSAEAEYYDTSHGVAEFGSYDAAGWQYIFGKPKDSQTDQPFIKAEELAKTAIIQQKTPVSLELPALPGVQLIADLTDKYGVQVQGIVPDPNTVVREELSVSLVPGTDIQNIDGSKAQSSISMRGNSLTNRLTGGARFDILAPQGGNDVLTGGAETDVFRLDDKSGFHNLITDFNHKLAPPGSSEKSDYDSIQFNIPALKRVELRPRTEMLFEGKKLSGVEVTAVAKDDKPITSVFIAGVKPDDVKEFIHQSYHPIWNDIRWLDANKKLLIEKPEIITIPEAIPSKTQSAINLAPTHLNEISAPGTPMKAHGKPAGKRR